MDSKQIHWKLNEGYIFFGRKILYYYLDEYRISGGRYPAKSVSGATLAVLHVMSDLYFRDLVYFWRFF